MQEDSAVRQTVGDLIEALSGLPKDTNVFTLRPPFTGVVLIPQNNGSVMITSPPPSPKETAP